MALSIFTNASSMASVNALNKSNSMLSTAMERLGTGKRINSAADDAAGLQIATRLQGQTNGMAVAQRNISDATALLQTAEGAFDEVSNIMYRMKDLATQAANDTNQEKDRDAINQELNELNSELNNIMKNTSYGGEKLFASGGKFSKEMNFQIGSTADEKMTVDLSKEFKASTASGASGASTSMIDKDGNFTGISASGSKYLSTVSGASGASATTTINLKDAEAAQDFMKDLESTLNGVGNVRAKLGANINRLGHTAANLANMKDNTDLALGNIRDADFASEASSMTRNQMLAQTSMSMLKQSNSMSGMVMSLLG
ncbi:flagellin [Enterobacter cancerogenus]|uniref:flagellin N-terminal helical domain-containing protein n=1 Tax=Enterobacter cancerogenus TaxID=69218 RepID=UPI000734F9C6|nr:flagellin [Enterobacter cancerogenus]KTQ45112.1 flagellin [Enterobacter cancerogenus]KTQ47488.1 flagellin [Enterobacter cancerogenus]KTQ70845.1 flagellin [Enterobacter cancerogenus]KTQ81447.1 flagellin [Enterobacter cancerogenus]MDT7009812.1 flagellin [Enterobacter cancerogenus]